MHDRPAGGKAPIALVRLRTSMPREPNASPMPKLLLETFLARPGPGALHARSGYVDATTPEATPPRGNRRPRGRDERSARPRPRTEMSVTRNVSRVTTPRYAHRCVGSIGHPDATSTTESRHDAPDTGQRTKCTTHRPPRVRHSTQRWAPPDIALSEIPNARAPAGAAPRTRPSPRRTRPPPIAIEARATPARTCAARAHRP